jgi:hypothetical protein
VIDGSPAYGFDKTHCQLQRFPSRGDKYYGDLISWLTVWIKMIKNGTGDYPLHDRVYRLDVLTYFSKNMG